MIRHDLRSGATNRLGAPGSATPGAPHASLVAFDWRQISWGAPPTDPGG